MEMKAQVQGASTSSPSKLSGSLISAQRSNEPSKKVTAGGKKGTWKNGQAGDVKDELTPSAHQVLHMLEELQLLGALGIDVVIPQAPADDESEEEEEEIPAELLGAVQRRQLATAKKSNEKAQKRAERRQLPPV